MNKLVFPLALALAATLATTGCKHGPNKITPLPGQPAAQVGDSSGPGTTLPPGGSMTGGETPSTGGGTSQVGGGPTSDFDPTKMDQDRTAFAAYTVHFAFDSSVVKKGEESKVSSVATALGSDANAKLLIEGHCDERGTEEYNRALGERRALSLREALAKAGVDPSRIRTISYGKDKPADPGHDESAWSKNRRGDFILLHPKN